MTERNTQIITLLTAAAALVGALCGYFLPDLSFSLGFLGQLFLGALKILIIPTLAAGVISGVTSFGELRRMGGVVRILAIYFVATTVIAAVLAVVAGWILAPAAQLGGFAGQVGGPGVSVWQSLSGVLGSLIPGNLFQAAVEGKYIGLVLLTVLLGGVLASIGLHGRTIVTFFRGLSDALHRVVGYVFYAAPLGVFSLVARAVADGTAESGSWAGLAGSYAIASLIAIGVYGLVILPLAMQLFGGRSMFSFFGDLAPAFLTAFGTSSKTAAFPVTLRCLAERSRLDIRATGTALPISTVLGFDGTIIFPVVATIVAASASGLTIGVGQILLVILVSIVASFATAGMPLSSLIAAPALFAMVGMSAGQIGIALAAMAALDWLLDRVRAVVNVGSDAVATALVAASIETRGSAMRPQRGRRPDRSERSDRDSEDSGRDRFSRRGEGFGDSRRRSGAPSDRPMRGRREDSGGRFPSQPSGPRPRPDAAERSPFQMKAGRTPALGVDSDKPVVSADRPPRETERPQRDNSERPQRDFERPSRDSERPSRDMDRPQRDSERPQREREPRRSGPGYGEGREGRPPRERGRRRPERGPEPAERRPIEEPVEETTTPRTETPRISPDVVARDLSRVSAQLREPQRGDERDPDMIEPPAFDLEASSGSDEDSFASGRRDVDDELPEFDSDLTDSREDFDGSDSGDTTEVIRSDERAEERSEAREPETSSAAEVSFGRSRHYRGAAFRKPETTDGEAPKEPTQEPTKELTEGPSEGATEEPGTSGFTTEDASFGRMKRKRTR